MDDTVRPPRGYPGCLRSQLLKLFEVLQKLVVKTAFLDVVLEKGRVCELRTPIVHDLVEYLIDQRKLFLDIIFCDFSIEVGLAYEDQRVKKLYGHSAVDVGFGSGQEYEILVGDCNVRYTIEQEDGIVPVLFGGDHLRAVVLYFGPSDIVLEAPVDQYLALDVNKDD